nr:hypothetical protein CFP56_33969 [Quercus suber]
MKIFELLKRFDTGMGAALLLFLTSGSSFFFSPYSTDLKTFLPTEREVNTISWFKDLGKGLYPFGVLLVEEFCTFKVLILSTLLRFIGIILMWLTVDSHITVTQPLLILCGFAFGASSAELIIRHFLRQSCMKKFSKNPLKHFLIIATGYTSLSPSFLIQIDLKFFENVDYKRLLMLALVPGLVTFGLSPIISKESNDDGHSAFIGVAILLAVILAVKPFTDAHKKTNITLTVLLYSLWVSNLLIGIFYSSRKRPEEEIEKKVTAEQKGKTRKWRSWNKGNLRVLYSIDFIVIWAAGAVGIAITTSVIDNLRLVAESLSNEPTNLNRLISLTAFSNFLVAILWVIVFIRERKKAKARTGENKGVTDSDSPSPSRSLS